MNIEIDIEIGIDIDVVSEWCLRVLEHRLPRKECDRQGRGDLARTRYVPTGFVSISLVKPASWFYS
ncbi:hypothetical protein [Streptomyces fradiae]|uniref:hypothetical protein n=1 Tax=Streptomyces fradiae TaxID=1906 RepID=UPI0035149EE2